MERAKTIVSTQQDRRSCRGKRRDEAAPRALAREGRPSVLLRTAIIFASLAVACGGAATSLAAPRLHILHSFGSFLRGYGPVAGLAADNAGNLYGTTEDGGAHNVGVVFELSPPAAGKTAWTQHVLHSFNYTDGSAPQARLIVDGEGDLYGTTMDGGAQLNGVVFELKPPAPGGTVWTENVLLSFNGPNGFEPGAGLLADDAGNLYGTTEGGGANGDGVVFELSPPGDGGTAWTQKVLHAFNRTNGAIPDADLIADGAGNLYGTTRTGGANGGGVAFELKRPAVGKTAWIEKVLFSFNVPDGFGPSAGLVADGAGNLYGATVTGGANSDGAVFELSPPKAGNMSWTETVLHSFNFTDGESPQSALITDGVGNLYGTTYSGGANGDGVVYELSPPVAGKTDWTETVLVSFNGANGLYPEAGLITDGSGNFYGTTQQGGRQSGGIAFKLTP